MITHMVNKYMLKIPSYIINADDQGPLLLTWFNFNPSMDK